MVSNNTNLDTAKSVWPYDEKIENNFNGVLISISPNSGLDSDYTEKKLAENSDLKKNE